MNYEITQLGQLQRSSRVEKGAGPWGKTLPDAQPSSAELAAVADAPDAPDTAEAAEAAAEAAAAAAVAAMGLELRGAMMAEDMLMDGMLVPMMAHRARRRRRRQPAREAQPLWAKAEVVTDAEAEARAEAEAAVEASRYGFRLPVDSSRQAAARVVANGVQPVAGAGSVAEAGSVAGAETVTEVGEGVEAGEEVRAAEAPKSVEVQERRLSSWHVASHIVFAEALASLTAEDCVQARPATPRAPPLPRHAARMHLRRPRALPPPSHPHIDAVGARRDRAS